MAINKPRSPDPLIFVPRQGKPQLLFVLLHGESASPEQLFPLADAIKQAFPASMVVLPYAFENIEAGDGKQGIAGYHWIDPIGLQESNYAGRVAQSLPLLIRQIREIQARFGLTGQQTALAGFSQGASMALEASQAEHDLAGRVLAFSGLYAKPPVSVSPATVLHFFHGANDQQVSVDQVESTLVRLGELQGDATLDVASRIGHELHDALIKQAIVRLQTCVPLRSWEDAMNALHQHSSGRGGNTLH
ncbi:esterase [Parapusillimonas granuli]|uniref:Esterase n=1 Tax=Parapusillimonas granuli TaxID=380911 RepID=A0A853G4Y0_9BURK|nr:esterase [Parapusillimonas granuli]MBB5214265.1 phospholipase/carboxylesterase [Parapusillimonas granuli]MEB2399092.1 esterase [Alcaligenaceae bacterium]NYT51369.1 esterase [Parapusillimonas granuli]